MYQNIVDPVMSRPSRRDLAAARSCGPAPAVMTLAAVTVVVTERILAWPVSLALTARRTSRFALFMDMAGEVMQGWVKER